MNEHVPSPWRKSSHSDGQGACVEIALFEDGAVGVRDSKNPRIKLLPDPTAWTAFLIHTKAGHFDL